MTRFQHLALLWTLLFIHPGEVCSVVHFLARNEGESVVLPCTVEQQTSAPLGVYLKRSWLNPTEVLFMYTESDFVAASKEDQERIWVSGDPGSLAVNVSLSQLRASDTDRYYCEFVVENPSSQDLKVPGKTEFFLLVSGVSGDTPGPVDVGLLETCAGGSAVLPCLPQNGEGLAVEGVSLKRQRGRAPVEVLYHSKRHRGTSSHFSKERFLLSSSPGFHGITYNLTLRLLQPEDSGMYSCQLLLAGRADSTSALGRRVFFVSVQGGQCGCSTYSTLLYALSSAVAVLLFLLLVVGAIHVKSRRGAKSAQARSQAPIYEEMAGMKPAGQRLSPRLLEEKEASEYKNCPVKKSCPENYYETPRGALCPRRGSKE